MTDETLVLILVFVFAVIALIALGARSFTRLVELILENGYKVAALKQEIRQVLTHSSSEQEHSTSSVPTEDTPTTPDNPSSSSSHDSQTTK